MWGEVLSSGRVAAASKESFLSFHSASLLSSAHMLSLSSTPSMVIILPRLQMNLLLILLQSSGMVLNSAAITQKVSQCTSRIAVLGTGLYCSFLICLAPL